MIWDGKSYGVLLLPYGNLLYYNEQILRDANVKVPTTPGEWLEAMAKTTHRDQGIFGLVTTTAEHPNMFIDAATWVLGERQDWLKGNQYSFDDPGVIAAMEQFRKSLCYAPPGTSSALARQLFIDGKAAFLRDGPWVWATLQKAKPEIRAVAQDGPVAVPRHHGRRKQRPAHARAARCAEEKLVWEFIAARRVAGLAGEIRAAHRFTGRSDRNDQRRPGQGRSASRGDHTGGRAGREPLSACNRRCARTSTSLRRFSAAPSCACNPRRNRPPPSSPICRKSLSRPFRCHDRPLALGGLRVAPAGDRRGRIPGRLSAVSGRRDEPAAGQVAQRAAPVAVARRPGQLPRRAGERCDLAQRRRSRWSIWSARSARRLRSGFSPRLLLNRSFPGRRWLRSFILLPWAVPGRHRQHRFSVAPRRLVWRRQRAAARRRMAWHRPGVVRDRRDRARGA